MTSTKRRKISAAERRRSPRVAVKLPVKIRNDKGVVEAQTRNISISGAYCTVDQFIPINTKLDVTLMVPEKEKSGHKCLKKMTCHGIVVRNQPEAVKKDHHSYGLAIFFTDFSRGDQDDLSSYVIRSLPPEEQEQLSKRNDQPVRYDPGKIFSRTDVGDRGFSISSANFRVLGEQINLSKNGICCQTDRQIPLFREIAVNLVLPPRR
ncbi:MAG: PilZ domain-containing protein, partial [Candidatus Aureabacteria bacterium]|nr:PilZ domain-containing protein [Candidatus Auribacterota bacterium]